MRSCSNASERALTADRHRWLRKVLTSQEKYWRLIFEQTGRAGCCIGQEGTSQQTLQLQKEKGLLLEFAYVFSGIHLIARSDLLGISTLPPMRRRPSPQSGLGTSEDAGGKSAWQNQASSQTPGRRRSLPPCSAMVHRISLPVRRCCSPSFALYAVG